MNSRRMIIAVLLGLAAAGCSSRMDEDARMVACHGYAAYFLGAAFLHQLPEPFEADLAWAMKTSPEMLGARVQLELLAGAARREAPLEAPKVQRARQEGTELARKHIGGNDARASARYLGACLESAGRTRT